MRSHTMKSVFAQISIAQFLDSVSNNYVNSDVPIEVFLQKKSNQATFNSHIMLFSKLDISIYF